MVLQGGGDMVLWLLVVQGLIRCGGTRAGTLHPLRPAHAMAHFANLSFLHSPRPPPLSPLPVPHRSAPSPPPTCPSCPRASCRPLTSASCASATPSSSVGVAWVSAVQGTEGACLPGAGKASPRAHPPQTPCLHAASALDQQLLCCMLGADPQPATHARMHAGGSRYAVQVVRRSPTAFCVTLNGSAAEVTTRKMAGGAFLMQARAGAAACAVLGGAGAGCLGAHCCGGNGAVKGMEVGGGGWRQKGVGCSPQGCSGPGQAGCGWVWGAGPPCAAMAGYALSTPAPASASECPLQPRPARALTTAAAAAAHHLTTSHLTTSHLDTNLSSPPPRLLRTRRWTAPATLCTWRRRWRARGWPSTPPPACWRRRATPRACCPARLVGGPARCLLPRAFEASGDAPPPAGRW